MKIPKEIRNKIIERIDSGESKTSENACWEWTGKNISNGYGRFSFQGNTMVAHKYIWQHLNGKTNLNICHTCDNRLCCNPSHLFEGTQKENMEDCARKGRVVSCKKKEPPTLKNLKRRWFLIT